MFIVMQRLEASFLLGEHWSHVKPLIEVATMKRVNLELTYMVRMISFKMVMEDEIVVKTVKGISNI